MRRGCLDGSDGAFRLGFWRGGAAAPVNFKSHLILLGLRE